MTQQRNVKANLPFSFCERCPNVELEKTGYYTFHGEDITYRVCTKAPICEKTVQMALDTIDKGEELR